MRTYRKDVMNQTATALCLPIVCPVCLQMTVTYTSPSGILRVDRGECEGCGFTWDESRDYSGAKVAVRVEVVHG